MFDESNVFTHFSLQHILTLVVVFSFAIFFSYWVKSRNSDRVKHLVAWIFPIVLFINECMESYVRVKYYNEPWIEELPLHLCRFSSVLTIILFLTHNQKIFGIVYFWILAGTMQALITPALHFGPPNVTYFLFFTGHSILVLGIFYHIIVYKLRPTLRSFLFSWIYINIYGGILIAINFIFDTNYMYLMHKPETGSMMDLFGDWPWYWIPMSVMAFVLFFVVYLPFFFFDLRKKWKKS